MSSVTEFETSEENQENSPPDLVNSEEKFKSKAYGVREILTELQNEHDVQDDVFVKTKKKQSTSISPQPTSSTLPPGSQPKVVLGNIPHEELDETERWKERNVVLTSLDHEENVEIVGEVFGDILKEVDKIVNEHETPAPLVKPAPLVNVTSPSHFKDHSLQPVSTPAKDKLNEIQEQQNLEVPKTLGFSDVSGIQRSDVKSAEYVSCTSHVSSSSSNDSFSPCSPVNDDIFHALEQNAYKFSNLDLPEELFNKMPLLPSLSSNELGIPDRCVKSKDYPYIENIFKPHSGIIREDVKTEITDESLINHADHAVINSDVSCEKHEVVYDPLLCEQNNSNFKSNESFEVKDESPINEVNSNVTLDLNVNDTHNGDQTEETAVISFEQEILDVSSSDEQYFMAPDSFEMQTEDIDKVVSVVLDQLKEAVVKNQASENHVLESKFVALNDATSVIMKEDISLQEKNQGKDSINDFVPSCPESESSINRSDDCDKQLFSASEYELMHTLPTLVDIVGAKNTSLGSENKLNQYCTISSEDIDVAEKFCYRSSDNSAATDADSAINLTSEEKVTPYKENVHLGKTCAVDEDTQVLLANIEQNEYSKDNNFLVNSLEINTNELQNSLPISGNAVENDVKNNFTCARTELTPSESNETDKTFQDLKEKVISDTNSKFSDLDQTTNQLINSTELLSLDVRNSKQEQANNDMTQQLNAFVGSELQKNDLLVISNEQTPDPCNKYHIVSSHEAFRDLTDNPVLFNATPSACTPENTSSRLLSSDVSGQNESALFNLHCINSELYHEGLSSNQDNMETSNFFNSLGYQESKHLQTSIYKTSDYNPDISAIVKDEKCETNTCVTSDILHNETTVPYPAVDENEQVKFQEVELLENIVESFSELKLDSDQCANIKERCADESNICVVPDIMDSATAIPYPAIDVSEQVNFQHLELPESVYIESFSEMKSDLYAKPCNSQEPMNDRNVENFSQVNNLNKDSNESPLLLVENKCSVSAADCKLDSIALDSEIVEQQIYIDSNTSDNLDANKQNVIFNAGNCSVFGFAENNLGKLPLQTIDKNSSFILDQKDVDTLGDECIKQPKYDDSQNLPDNVDIFKCNMHEVAMQSNLKMPPEVNCTGSSLNQMPQPLVADSGICISISSEIDFASAENKPVEQEAINNTQQCEELKKYENELSFQQNADITDSSKNISGEQMCTETQMLSVGTADNVISCTNLLMEDSFNTLPNEDGSHDETLCTSEQDKTIVNSEDMFLLQPSDNNSSDNIEIPVSSTGTNLSYQSLVGESGCTFSLHNIKVENNDQQSMSVTTTSPICKEEIDFAEHKSLQNEQNFDSLHLFKFSPVKANELEQISVKVEETGSSEYGVSMPCQLGEWSSSALDKKDTVDNKPISKKNETKSCVDTVGFDIQNEFGSLQEALLRNIDSFSQKHIVDASYSVQTGNDGDMHELMKEQEVYKNPSKKQDINLSDAENAFSATQFTEGEFRSAAEFFKDPSAFEFLQKAGSTTAFQESCLGRMSLFLKFDPLLTGSSRQNTEAEEENCSIVPDDSIFPIETQHSVVGAEGVNPEPLVHFTPKKAQECKNQLIDISCTPVKAMKTFTEEEMNQGLKMQELLYQEKLINKDKGFIEEIKILEKEKEILKSQTKTVKDLYMISRGVTSELLDLMKPWATKKEEERIEFTISKQKITKERDQALEDLQNVEKAFSDLIRRYENAKSVLETMKQNEIVIKQQVESTEKKLQDQEKMYDLLRIQAEEKIELANSEILSAKKEGEAELAVIKALLRKEKMKTSTLERTLEQTVKENSELSSICDELITKVGNR